MKTPGRAKGQNTGRFCYLTGGQARAIRDGAGGLGPGSPSGVHEPADLPDQGRLLRRTHAPNSNRKPMLLRLSGVLLRIAQHSLSALLFQAHPACQCE